MAGWKTIGNGTINKGDEAKGAPYYGRCTIEGIDGEINIGAWVKPGKDGSKFFSLKFSVKEDEQQRQKPVEESDVPF